MDTSPLPPWQGVTDPSRPWRDPVNARRTGAPIGAGILVTMAAEADPPVQGPTQGLVVALDGPASSGKSSVGAAAAAQLGYRFCDTGLLYRAVTWLALHRGVSADDAGGLVELVGEIHLLDSGGGRLAHVAIDDVDRTDEVRGPEVDVAVSAISGVGGLRLALLTRQRQLAAEGRIIMAGRDIGTVVLPDADLKLFLDASVAERAQRRILERGIDPDSSEAAEIIAELKRRDELDSSRPIAPLRAAEDAVVIRTDGNAFETTVGLVVDAIRRAESMIAATAAPGPDAPPAEPEAAVPVPRQERTPRVARRPIKPTPIATRMGFLVSLGSAVLRGIARAIVRLRIEGDLTVLPKSGPLIIAGNHASSADPVLIGAFLNKILGRPLNWLGKRELTEFRLTGWAFRIAGIHPVDRDAADLEAFRTAMRILEAGQVLAVFPEGTRSRDGGLQPVREGVGMLALRSGAPVLPVAVIDSDRMWPRGHLLPSYGKRVTVRFGTPFNVAEALRAAPDAANTGPDAGSKAGMKGRRTRRGETEAATRLVMTRIAELLPPRQRGVYAAEVTSVPES